MMATTHISFSFLLYFALALAFRPSFNWFVAIMIVAVGSIVPDIDHPHSLITRQSDLFQSVSRRLTKVTTHRGVTHTLLSAIILSAIIGIVALAWQASIFISVCFFVGYVSHLLADSLNPTGVEWLYPFRELKLAFKIRTGSQAEKVFFYLVSIIAGYLLYVYYLQ